MKKMWHRKRGFTLIELLIVVAIIGILAGIAIPNFLGARTKARVSRAVADMRNIGNALEMYYIDNTAYPASTSDITSELVDNYISSIPDDPFNSGGNRTGGDGAISDNGYGYYVSPSDTPTMWLLVSNGPDADDDVNSPDFGDNRYAGVLGGSEGVTGDYYGTTAWYNPDDGTVSEGDLGVGGP